MKGEGGRMWAMSLIVRPQVSLDIYNLFNTPLLTVAIHMYNPYFSMKFTDKINNEALFPRFGLVMHIYLLIAKKILKNIL